MRVLTPFTALLLCVLSVILVISSSIMMVEAHRRADEHGNVGNARGKQSDIDNLQHELVQKMQELEHQYAHKKVPVQKERNQFLSTVPGFWKRTLTNHPNFGHIAHGEDSKILDHLTSVDIEEVSPEHNQLPDGSIVSFSAAETDAAPGHHRHASKYLVRLSFESNQYFTDNTLWRLVDSYTSDIKTARTSGVNWMPGQRPANTASFFQFFETPGIYDGQAGSHSLSLHRVLDIAHLLRYEIFANPFTYYDIPTYADLAAEESRRREQLMKQHASDEEEIMAQYQDQDNQDNVREGL